MTQLCHCKNRFHFHAARMWRLLVTSIISKLVAYISCTSECKQKRTLDISRMFDIVIKKNLNICVINETTPRNTWIEQFCL